MRPLAAIIAAFAATSSLTACGTQTLSTTSGGAHPATSTPTGRVACSTSRLPARGDVAHLEVRLGGTTAVLTGRVHGDRWMPSLARPALTLTSAAGSTTVVLRAPRLGPGGQTDYTPSSIGADRNVSGYLCLASFAPGQPVALSESYSGGAHCCTAVQVVDTSGHQSHLQTGNVIPSLRIVDDQLVLASGDDAFNNTYADFADSCAPVSLLVPQGGAFRDVTTEHPKALQADARRAWRYAQERSIRLGFLACWAADQERLGRDARVWRTLAGLQQEGKLRLPHYLTGPSWWKDGAAYVAELRKFLTERGYRQG